jgi:hypothetical protein
LVVGCLLRPVPGTSAKKRLVNKIILNENNVNDIIPAVSPSTILCNIGLPKINSCKIIQTNDIYFFYLNHYNCLIVLIWNKVV